jgi:hypothetical protein
MLEKIKKFWEDHFVGDYEKIRPRDNEACFLCNGGNEDCYKNEKVCYILINRRKHESRT